MLKQGGVWKTVDWQTALEYVANGLKNIKNDHGVGSIGALVSPHSTVEELYLAGALVRGLGNDNIDYRLRNAEFAAPEGIRWLGTSIASLSTLQRVLVVGSNLRKDHPLFAQRIRQAARHGAQINAIGSVVQDWAMPVQSFVAQGADEWVQTLGGIASAVAEEKGVAAPQGAAAHNDATQAIARSLLGGERKAVLLGNAAAHHAQATQLLALANWIGEHTGASVGYLTEAANTVGAQFAGAHPVNGGLNAGQMLSGGLKAALLLNTEPVYDSAAGANAAAALSGAEMVVTLSPFKANLEFSDVLLPIAPFTETSGSFINAEGRLQSFHAVVRPLGDTRPAWKVLRVLANLLGVSGFDFETSQDVLARATNAAAGTLTRVPAEQLSNVVTAAVPAAAGSAGEPVVASIYQLDGLVRRSTSLQLTADARLAREGVAA
ncbi:MAG: NADH-quinone oxidoreductase subunit G, partial [Comamonadaceae bacterium]